MSTTLETAYYLGKITAPDAEIGLFCVIEYIDGFSREKSAQRRACVPNRLFFDTEKGLLSILQRYNFTIEENTPNDVDVALDPELLGKVFENLLGAYNPETKETARNLSGSFYTPREIVNYMVDESLKAYLCNNGIPAVEESATASLPIIQKLQAIKILDPACGSGAFPMGILNRIMEITISGTKTIQERKLGKLLKKMKKEDILICSELSRLGRNLLMIMGILNECMNLDIQVWTIKDNYRLGSDINSKVLTFAFGLSAEIERNLI